MEERIKISRRHLPHWTLEGATYYVTFNILEGEILPEEQQMILEQIKMFHAKSYILIAAIVMPDHVHILLTPYKGFPLSRIMKGLKGTTARLLNIRRGTSGSFWQTESYDRIIRDVDELEEKLNYMYNNPLKRGLVDVPQNYLGWYFNPDYGKINPDNNGRSDIPV
ncbi:MAG: transposase [bacterium]|nr:transposase [bacterium]